jgi:hypothetical protein
LDFSGLNDGILSGKRRSQANAIMLEAPPRKPTPKNFNIRLRAGNRKTDVRSGPLGKEFSIDQMNVFPLSFVDLLKSNG